MNPGGNGNNNGNRKLTPEQEAELTEFLENEFLEHPIDRRQGRRRADEGNNLDVKNNNSGRTSSDRRQNSIDLRKEQFRQKFLDLISVIRSSTNGSDQKED